MCFIVFNLFPSTLAVSCSDFLGGIREEHMKVMDNPVTWGGVGGVKLHNGGDLLPKAV